jgi:TonB family protein
MTDNELSSLLQEWKRTPAPTTLDARVFRSRKVVVPRWWDRVPPLVTALSGVAVGGLVVFGLITLVSDRASAPVSPETPAPLVRPAAPAAEPVEELPPVPPKARRTPRIVAAPRPAPTLSAVAPTLIYGPSAIYPPGAQALATTTNVKVRIRIDKDGHVVEATVIDGDPLLDDAAIETVMGWVFRPYMLNGAPVDMASEVTVSFTSGAPKAKK